MSINNLLKSLIFLLLIIVNVKAYSQSANKSDVEFLVNISKSLFK